MQPFHFETRTRRRNPDGTDSVVGFLRKSSRTVVHLNRFDTLSTLQSPNFIINGLTPGLVSLGLVTNHNQALRMGRLASDRSGAQPGPVQLYVQVCRVLDDVRPRRFIAATKTPTTLPWRPAASPDYNVVSKPKGLGWASCTEREIKLAPKRYCTPYETKSQVYLHIPPEIPLQYIPRTSHLPYYSLPCCFLLLVVFPTFAPPIYSVHTVSSPLNNHQGVLSFSPLLVQQVLGLVFPGENIHSIVRSTQHTTLSERIPDSCSTSYTYTYTYTHTYTKSKSKHAVLLLPRGSPPPRLGLVRTHPPHPRHWQRDLMRIRRQGLRRLLHSQRLHLLP